MASLWPGPTALLRARGMASERPSASRVYLARAAQSGEPKSQAPMRVIRIRPANRKSNVPNIPNSNEQTERLQKSHPGTKTS